MKLATEWWGVVLISESLEDSCLLTQLIGTLGPDDMLSGYENQTIEEAVGFHTGEYLQYVRRIKQSDQDKFKNADVLVIAR